MEQSDSSPRLRRAAPNRAFYASTRTPGRLPHRHFLRASFRALDTPRLDQLRRAPALKVAELGSATLDMDRAGVPVIRRSTDVPSLSLVAQPYRCAARDRAAASTVRKGPLIRARIRRLTRCRIEQLEMNKRPAFTWKSTGIAWLSSAACTPTCATGPYWRTGPWCSTRWTDGKGGDSRRVLGRRDTRWAGPFRHPWPFSGGRG